MSVKKTFTIIKPGGVARGAIGRIIHRHEQAGLRLAAMREIAATREQLEEHYRKDEDWYKEKGSKTIQSRMSKKLPIEKPAIDYGKDIIEEVIRHMMSGSIVIMIWEGENAVEIVKYLTDSIRSDFGISMLDNAFHRSDSDENAEKEIALWKPFF